MRMEEREREIGGKAAYITAVDAVCHVLMASMLSPHDPLRCVSK